MQVAFAKRALKDPDLRMAYTVHKMSSLLGGMLFIADDLYPKTPYLHAAWHLAAAVGVGTCNKLLQQCVFTQDTHINKICRFNLLMALDQKLESKQEHLHQISSSTLFRLLSILFFCQQQHFYVYSNSFQKSMQKIGSENRSFFPLNMQLQFQSVIVILGMNSYMYCKC